MPQHPPTSAQRVALGALPLKTANLSWTSTSRRPLNDTEDKNIQCLWSSVYRGFALEPLTYSHSSSAFYAVVYPRYYTDPVLLCSLGQIRWDGFSLGWKRDETDLFSTSGNLATILTCKVDLEHSVLFSGLGIGLTSPEVQGQVRWDQSLHKAFAIPSCFYFWSIRSQS